MNFSFKKGTSRMIASKIASLRELQSIYSCRMLRALKDDELLINVDESSYSRSIKRDYSWLPKGISSPIINTR